MTNAHFRTIFLCHIIYFFPVYFLIFLFFFLLVHFSTSLSLSCRYAVHAYFLVHADFLFVKLHSLKKVHSFISLSLSVCMCKLARAVLIERQKCWQIFMSAHNRVWEKMRQKNKRHHRKHLYLALLSVVLCFYSQQNLSFVRNAEKKIVCTKLLCIKQIWKKKKNQ